MVLQLTPELLAAGTCWLSFQELFSSRCLVDPEWTAVLSLITGAPAPKLQLHPAKEVT